MKEKLLTILKIFGKFILLILIWSGGIAILSQLDKQIEAIGKPASAFIFEFFPLLFILIPSLILWKFLDKEKISLFGFATSRIGKNLLKGAFLGIIWIGLAVIGIYLTCQVQTNFNLKMAGGMLLAYFVILLINTIMQEVLCRGYLYKIIEKPFNSLYAVLFTSVFFVLLHPGAINSGFIGIINVFCAGLVFGFTRKMTGNLWMPIAIHITWNFIDSILLGTSPLGLYPHLDWLIVQGKDIFTGGKDGLGASLVVVFTFPVIFSILYFDVLKINQKNQHQNYNY
jgi:uncharacterized protein